MKMVKIIILISIQPLKDLRQKHFAIYEGVIFQGAASLQQGAKMSALWRIALMSPHGRGNLLK